MQTSTEPPQSPEEHRIIIGRCRLLILQNCKLAAEKGVEKGTPCKAQEKQINES
ncbi:MAG: hypothetical protein QXU95_03240 [Candidatus Bathyarchaeia archaeon]